MPILKFFLCLHYRPPGNYIICLNVWFGSMFISTLAIWDIVVFSDRSMDIIPLLLYLDLNDLL